VCVFTPVYLIPASTTSDPYLSENPYGYTIYSDEGKFRVRP